MTIKQQGGIFGRNPFFKDVDVSGSLTSNNISVSASDPYITITDSDTGVDHELDGQSGIGNFSINVDKNNEGSNPGFVVTVQGTQFFRIDDSGDILFYDNTGSSADLTWDASAGNLAFANGGGIDFSATSGTGTSELFDDYEEGTWTVTLYDAASGGNASATTSTGYYTKMGRQVTIWFSLTNIDTTGMTAGNVMYLDLPFATGSGNISTGSIVTDNVSFGSTGTALYPRAGSGAARASFKNVTSASGDGNSVVSHFSTGVADIDACTMTYFV